jgi:hypothetical protein
VVVSVCAGVLSDGVFEKPNNGRQAIKIAIIN